VLELNPGAMLDDKIFGNPAYHERLQENDVKSMHKQDLQDRQQSDKRSLPLHELNSIDKATAKKEGETAYIHPYFTLRSDGVQRYRQSSIRECEIETPEQLHVEYLQRIPEHMKKHVVIAGGAVYGSFYRHRWDDIDVFLVDIDEESIATDILRSLVKIYNPNNSSILQRTSSALTISGIRATGKVGRRIQIVLRMYSSIQQLLYGFDIQCAAICIRASEPGKIFASNLARFFFISSLLIVDTDRRSQTYPRRLRKYLERGAILVFPRMDVQKVAQTFAERILWSKANVKLADCNLHLSVRMGDRAYKGFITMSRGLQSTMMPTENQIVDYDVSNTRWERALVTTINVNRFRRWLTMNDDTQPFLVATVREVDEEVDVLRLLCQCELCDRDEGDQHIHETCYLRLHKERAKKLNRNLSLKWRKIDPDLQWSNSLNPLVLPERDWYSDYYTDELHHETVPYRWNIDWTWSLRILSEPYHQHLQMNAYLMMSLFGTTLVPMYASVRNAAVATLIEARARILADCAPAYHVSTNDESYLLSLMLSTTL